ncbi:MAG TPA: DUF2846 domain-containing protein [Stellaceae bacterium]|nr:DUF2846 domain-containing protein [Stellaceae bacterium]
MTRCRKFGLGLARCGAALLLLVAAAGFAPRADATVEPYPAATPGAVPAGMARIWIYREYAPYQSLATPYVRLNGAIVGVSQPGEVFYRDVPAGTYTVSVDSLGMDVNQFTTVDLAPGQQAFVKVLVSDSWDSGGGGDRGGWARPTFYTWQIAPAAAEAEISHLPIYNGG